jgi:hypothetical protein
MHDSPNPRGAILRRLLVFQLKLAADALRDLVLSPVAIGAVLLDLLQRNEPGTSHFERLMAFGHRSDRFIDLFGATEAHAESIDGLIDRAEASLRKPGPPPGD